MKSTGIFYAQKMQYPPKFKTLPIVEIGWTQETEDPYRKGYCIVFKPPFTVWAAAVGIWGKKQDETQALVTAIKGRALDIDPEQIMEW